MHETKQVRSFGLIVGGLFALVGVWPLLRYGHTLRLWAVLLGGVLMALALLQPRSLTQVYRLWMTIGEALGWLNTRLILGALFYLLFTPIGWYMRLRGYDPMRRALVPEMDSYRVVRQPRAASHMRHQY